MKDIEDIISKHIGGTRQRAYPQPVDIVAALSDYCKIRASQRVDDAEPMARAWNRDRSDIFQIRESVGMTSSDFASALEISQSQLLQQAYTDVASDIFQMSRPLEVDNFIPQSTPALHLGELPEVFEDEQLTRLPSAISESANKAMLRSYGGTVSFSKSVFSTYGGEILTALTGHAAAIYSQELRSIASVLASATLPTGSGSLDATGLATAVQTLRSQSNAAELKMNYRLASVIVPPSLEVAAKTQLRNADMSAVRVCVNPYLSSESAWYGVAAPAQSPLLRVTLRGGGLPRLELNTRRGIETGVEFAILHDVGYQMANSGLGMVKMS